MILTAVVVIFGPYSLEMATVLMVNWPGFSEEVRSQKWDVIILGSSLGIAALYGYDQFIRELSILNHIGFDPKFSHSNLDNTQNAAYAVQLIGLSTLPFMNFTDSTERRRRATDAQVVLSALAVMPFAFALKWGQFVQTIPIGEGVNRWGIRLFGAGPNSEMTIMVPLACAIVGACALGGLVFMVKSAARRYF